MKKIEGFGSLLLGILLGLGNISLAQAKNLEVRVNVKEASIREAPNGTAKVVLKVASGKILAIDGVRKNGFFKLKTKSGKELWISDREAKLKEASKEEVDAAKDLVEGSDSDDGQDGKEADDDTKKSGKKITFDLGLSSGASNGSGYLELNLGVNYYLKPWLIFRNAPFYRRAVGESKIFGLDSSLNGVTSLELGKVAGVNFLAGGGYRFRNVGTSAPFLEGAVGVNLAGFGIQLGIKQIYNSMIDEASDNETQFIVQAGGGASF